jgi:hypothetical protein
MKLPKWASSHSDAIGAAAIGFTLTGGIMLVQIVLQS